MTPKQIERLQKKISDIKRFLAAEKKKFGCYDDSRGIRYLPPKYFIQMGDYPGGLKYVKWFAKNFPDDIGFPNFLFEWTIILFKNGKAKEAEKKAFETYQANTYLFDKFFGRPIIPVDKWEGSNLEAPSYTEYLDYDSHQQELANFSRWLKDFMSTETFIKVSDSYVELMLKLKGERNIEARELLIMEADRLAESL